MFLARVIGTVVATSKDVHLEGQKLLLIEPLRGPLRESLSGAPRRGGALVALDAVGAGTGEIVYYCRGREASFPWLPAEVPTDLSIVGILDPASNPAFFSGGGQ